MKLRRTLSEPVKTGHTPPTKNAGYYTPGEVKFIKTDNLREDRIDTSEVHLLSELGNSRIAASELKRDDVIVTIIGATEEIIGRAARVFTDLGRANINQNVAVIRTTIPAGFLSVFLNTRFGREQLIWLSRQTGQVNLNCREVEEVGIPIFSERFVDTVHDLNSTRHELLQNAITCFHRAEQLLLAEVGVQNWRSAHPLTYSKSYSEVMRKRRLDAEHFQPKYEHLRGRIKSYAHGFCRITDLATPSTETVDPWATAHENFRYVELANIDHTIGVIDSINHVMGKDAPSRARMLLRAGSVIASTVEGSLEKVALVSQELDMSVGSTGFFVFRPKAVEGEYMLVLAKSLLVRDQMRCEASGTILAAVSAAALPRVLVPKVPSEKRGEIASLVLESHDARRRARVILEKAKQAVETAMEQGEQTAMEFLN